jgi:hypothetical protein
MELIAQRILIYRDKESEKEIPIRLFAPENKKDHWVCRFEIDWPDGTLKRYGAGQDSVQALVHTLSMIGSLLYSSDEHKDGNLGWGMIGYGYGFPVVNTIRDIPVGSDAKYF